MKERSVLQITNYSSNYAGNFIPLLVHLEKALARIGLRQVFVLPETARAYKWSAALEADGHHVVYLPLGSATEISALATLAREENCAILHTHFNALDIAAWLAVKYRLGSRKAPALVWHCHSGWAPGPRRPLRILKDIIKLRVMARSVRLIAVSESVKNEQIEHGCPPSRVQVVCNGVDLARIDSSARSKEEACSLFGFAPEESIVLALGWDPLRKGVDTLVKAFSQIQARRQMRLVLVGGASMEALLHQYLGSSWPDWLTVIPTSEDLPKMYYAADLFVSASRVEGFPYGVLEALAAGVPVVSTDIPALAWAREIPSVLFVNPEDPEEMAEKIITAIEWPAAMRRERVNQGALIVRKNFGADTWAESMIKCYTSIVNQT